MRYFLAVAVLLVVTGCATTFRPWNLSMIQEGMDREQVVEILGEPDSAETVDGSEQLLYTYEEDYNPPPSESVPFYSENSDMAFRDLENGRRFKQYEYVVTLVDGKVVGYEER